MMTTVAPNKLFTVIWFIFITERVPESDLLRSFEALMTVFHDLPHALILSEFEFDWNEV